MTSLSDSSSSTSSNHSSTTSSTSSSSSSNLIDSTSSSTSLDMELSPFLSRNGDSSYKKDDEILDVEHAGNGYSHKAKHHRVLSHSSLKQKLLNYIARQPSPSRYILQFVFFVFPILVLLYMIYRALFAAFDHGFFDPDVEDKIMVIYPSEELPFEITKAQGAFSDFVAVVGAILYGQYYGAAAIKVYYNNPLYVDADKGDNYFDYFYENSLIALKPQLDLSNCCEEIHFNSWIARMGKFGTFSRFAIGNNQRPHSEKFPFRQFRSRNDLSTVIHRFIHPKKTVSEAVAKVMKEEWLSSQSGVERENVIVVGVHYRGTDKKALYPYRSPSYAVFDYYIRQVFYLQAYDRHILPNSFNKSGKMAFNNLVLFVATDEIEFIDWISTRFASISVSYLKDSPRLSKTPAPGIDVETTGTHKSKKFSGYQKGFTSLVDCLLLAETDYIVKTRSSLSDVALMYNAHMNFTVLLGPSDPEYSTDTRLIVPESIAIWDDHNPLAVYNPMDDAGYWKAQFGH